jgi:hypothetical protein
MTAEQFAYWLQGYAELNAEPPNAEQWQAIREHLALVFKKVTPNWDAQPAMRAPIYFDPNGAGSVPITATRTIC